MDIRAAYFTPEQAREIMDMVALLKTSGMLRSSSRVMRPDDPGPHPVYVKNESGEEVPAFACMQVVGTEDVGDLTYVKIDKPDSTDGQYLFNGESPIESGGFGMSYPWGVVRMLTDGTITENEIYGPKANSWEIEELEGGPFVVYGADNAADDVARGRFLGGGGGSRLVRFEMISDWSSGAADADFFEMDGTAIGSDALRDPEEIFAELGIGDRGLATLQGGQYWAVKGPSTIGRVVVFTLSDDFAGTTASADFSEVDGTPIGPGVLRDPTGIVGNSLTVGDKGLAHKKGSQYVFLNAHCDQEGE